MPQDTIGANSPLAIRRRQPVGYLQGAPYSTEFNRDTHVAPQCCTRLAIVFCDDVEAFPCPALSWLPALADLELAPLHHVGAHHSARLFPVSASTHNQKVCLLYFVGSDCSKSFIFKANRVYSADTFRVRWQESQTTFCSLLITGFMRSA